MPKAASTRRPQTKPKMGQHFLASEDLAARDYRNSGRCFGEHGAGNRPGRGALLTSLLAQRARRLIAVELDRVLAAQLRMKFGHGARTWKSLKAMFWPSTSTRFSAQSLGLASRVIESSRSRYSGGQSSLLHNVRHSAAAVRVPASTSTSIVIMVQREVADRIAAEPGGRDYGLLSATAQLYARVEKLFTLPPGAFVPPPKVHSSVLRLTIDPQQEKLGVAGDGFIDFLRQSFGQKRKTLWNNLKLKYEEAGLKRALAEAKVKGTARAETLSLEESAAIYRALREAHSES